MSSNDGTDREHSASATRPLTALPVVMDRAETLVNGGSPITKNGHPGATGVFGCHGARLNISRRQKNSIIALATEEAWHISRIDREALVTAVEEAISFYVGLRDMARESSAAAVKRHLREACHRASKLERALGSADEGTWEKLSNQLNLALKALDGNSRALLAREGWYSSAPTRLSDLVSMLNRAMRRAEIEFSASGGRPLDERYQFAAMIQDALQKHTSARLSSKRDGLFERMLRLGFALAGEQKRDLHSLAERIVATNPLIEESEGVRRIDRPQR